MNIGGDKNFMAKNTKKRAIIYSNVKQNKKKEEEKNKLQNQKINLNDEVIIGFNSKKNNQIIQKKGSVKKKKSIKQVKKIKKKIKIPCIIKIFTVIVVISIATFAFLKSSLFNVKEIVVQVKNNNVLTEYEIKELADISIGENIFSIRKKNSIENIKRNSYVEDVEIKRIIPNKIQIIVEERLAKFQLETSDGYVYVDKQGIVIDKSTEKKDCITITGHKTSDIINGNSLCYEDINKLLDVLQICKEIENNELRNDVSKVDISDSNDYLVYFESLGKMAHIGDVSSINDKMTRVAKILKEESEYEGEIFVNVDLNNGEYPYFREKV